MAKRLAASLFLATALAACAGAPQRPVAVPAPPAPSTPVACQSCGRIVRIETIEAVQPAARTGAVLGGVVGGVLSGPRKEPATGAPPRKTYRLLVRLDDGRQAVFNQAAISPNLRVGSHVRIDRGRVVLLR